MASGRLSNCELLAIASLQQERDYLLSIGRYDEAEEIDGEIERLKDQLKEVKEAELKSG